MIASVLVLLVVAFTVGRFALGSVPRRRAAGLLDRDRVRTLARGVEAVAVLLLGRALVDWSSLTLLPWAALVALTAAGAAGAVLRWGGLPWFEDPARRRSRTTGLAATVAVSAVLIGVLG
ncbi:MULTISPECIES: hypothetical protein [unclassified Rathayibacter]|uniref:hypothetical protein n=1 Tax=unclassified Rathayibacter TaxID=2609250 RepID=UPI000CE88987|nr:MULTISPECIES: hypothetical protein [unclassified Rathayibacter]PPG49670.1 hypothetical protein C5C24_12190 [Rathayibacter sp. AY2B3]PPI25369.1 hypothetical protein C5D44_11180 [Rathayibacter sp. AY1B5]